MPGKDLLFKEWQAANRRAHSLEQAVTRACLDALEGHGEWPSAEERLEAEKARGIANDLFQVAMKQIDERARDNKR